MHNKKIILNYLPPAIKYIPSCALSILKSFLNQNNFQSSIMYWNILLDTMLEKEKKESGESGEDLLSLLPFLYLLAEDCGDQKIINKLFIYFHQLNFENLIGEELFFEKNHNQNILENIKNKVIEIITGELNKIDFNQILLWGISGKFFQWIPGIILAKEIKRINPSAPVVIGGFGNKEEAIEILKSCKNFDYAVYGEGEYPLADLCNYIQNGTPLLKNIPRLVYREKEEIKISETSKSNFLDFENYIFPDYSDYLNYSNQLKNIPHENKKNIDYPINSIRSCLWNKCKFCRSNYGYKYQERSPESVVKEIISITNKYNTYTIRFMDNDVIGKDFKRFENLLDMLIELNVKNNMKYNFWMQIILYNDLDAQIYKKMFLAGIKRIYAGYEAVSDTLLKKMNKVNGFTNNILYLKSCMKYEIYAFANIITMIPDEAIENIRESIKNLHFIRFFFHGEYFDFSHTYSQFILYKEAKYNKLLSDEERQKYVPFYLYNFLSSNLIAEPFNVFSYMSDGSIEKREEWKIFQQVESFYKKHKYSYEILRNGNDLYYFEYKDKKLVFSIILSELEFSILSISNDKVISLDEMLLILLKTNPDITKEKIQNILSELKKHYLVYYNENYSSIVSIIDTKLLN